MEKELLLFQVGPVQEFIAQAETLGDLRIGSEMLSEVTAAALRTIPDYETEDVFPAVKKEALEGIPNRFLVFVPKGRGEELARAAAEAAREALVKMAEEAWPELLKMAKEEKTGLDESRHDAYRQQVEAFLQTTWTVLKQPSGQMGADYKTIGKLMALRRNVRAFEACHEEATGGVKDFLSGKEFALDVADGRADNRNGGRGAMNLIKKARWTDAEKEAYKKPDNKLGSYIAVLALDGDHMGGKLSGFATQAEHRAFSERLAQFAQSVFLKPDDGQLIYAGGDDVLAVVKATRAIPLAQELAALFKAKVAVDGITASVGIAIGSSKAPLQDLVHEAHAAESRAKRVYGRDALAVSVVKRSGEILHWGCKWSSKALEIYAQLAKASGEDSLSRFAYKLASFLAPYDLASCKKLDAAMRDVVWAETQHVLEQTEGAKDALSKAPLEAYLDEEGVTAHPEDYLGLFLCEAFIDRPRGE